MRTSSTAIITFTGWSSSSPRAGWRNNLRCYVQFLRLSEFLRERPVDVAQRIGLGQERRARHCHELMQRTAPRSVDDRETGPHLMHELRERRPVHARTEIDVGEENVAIGAGEKMAQCAAGVGRGHYGKTLVGQRLGHQLAEQGLILDQ